MKRRRICPRGPEKATNKKSLSYQRDGEGHRDGGQAEGREGERERATRGGRRYVNGTSELEEREEASSEGGRKSMCVCEDVERMGVGGRRERGVSE